MFLGANTLECESSRERKFPGQFTLGNESSREREGQGAKGPGSELARVLLADSLQGTRDASVRAAAAGIIAADFTAVPTDSPLPVGVAQRLPAASQRC